MLKDELIQIIKKHLEVAVKEATVRGEGVFFNPVYAEKLINKIPELKKVDIKVAKTETEDKHGKHITSKIFGPNDKELYLGSVLLSNGKVIPQKIIEVDDFINFFKDSLPDMIQ